MLKVESPAKHLMAHGISTCAGCSMELAARYLLKAAGPQSIVVIPPGCAALLSGFGAETVVKVPVFQGNLENTAAYAAGIRAGLEVLGKEGINVVGFAGDGATVDIGLQALSAAFERGDHILYVCYDNEAYMNTGIQGSASTFPDAWTTTTPAGKEGLGKNMLEIAAAHRIPYAATASAGYVNDLARKLTTAVQAAREKGPAYLHISTPCPTGWRFDPALTIAVAKAAVQTRAWNLVEVVDGNWRLTVEVKDPKPIGEYLRLQGRFRALTPEQEAKLQQLVDSEYEKLLAHLK